jgi:hypothetical protein
MFLAFDYGLYDLVFIFIRVFFTEEIGQFFYGLDFGLRFEVDFNQVGIKKSSQVHG